MLYPPTATSILVTIERRVVQFYSDEIIARLTKSGVVLVTMEKMTERSSTALETLVFGIDGACLRVLEPLFENGDAPNLADIFQEGVGGVLESQVPPWTASAWPSVYTGVNPGKHGVFGFLHFEGYDWDVVNASHIRERTIWDYLDRDGQTSVVVNAPVTYPPPEIDGAIVPGYLAPENPQCQPTGLLEDIRKEIGDYRVYASAESAENVTRDDRLEEYRELAGMRGAAFRYLAERFNPRFGFVQFQHTDTILHECPQDPKAVKTVYGAVDKEVGGVIDACDPDTIIVVSDHGLGPHEKRVRVNEVLRDGGFVRASRGGKGMPTWASIRNNRLAVGQRRGSTQPGLIEHAIASVARFGLTAQRFGKLLDVLGIRAAIQHRVPDEIIRAGSEQVDFPRSEAYMRSRVECGIRINLEGREPAGAVSPEDYDKVRKRLVSLLSDLESPEGKPVFEDVAPREEYFHGPAVDDAVDVVTVPRGFDYYVTTWLMGDHFTDPEPPGWDHKRNGVIACRGKGIDTDEPVVDAKLFDVAPTVLATLGLPKPERMDGRPLPVVGDLGETSYPHYETAQKEAIDDETVEARLADLGYLE